jgi:hypothetical protein
MKKNILIILICFSYAFSYAQKYQVKNFIGYVNYMNLPDANIRNKDLSFFIDMDNPEWISKNRIRKISYLKNGVLEQENQFFDNGEKQVSLYNSGTLYKTSKQGNDYVTQEYNRDKVASIYYKFFKSNGALDRTKKQFAGAKDSTVNKFTYSDNRIVKNERFFNNKIQSKYEFEYKNGNLVQMTNTDYKIEVKPNQTKEAEKVIYKYDENNNCISIENTKFFANLKDSHSFVYDVSNKLIREDYTLSEGSPSSIQKGIIEYNYNKNDKLSMVVEVNNSKKSTLIFNYNEDGKISSVNITGDQKATSSYMYLGLFADNMNRKLNVKYDKNGNIIEVLTFVNGELADKVNYDIEYY